MQIINEYKDNTNFYTFISRGTEYTIVIKDNDKAIQVWTNTRAWGVNLKFFDSIDKFASANKIFNNFSKLIEVK